MERVSKAEFIEIFRQAQKGRLPADFTHWDWKDKGDRTVAHYAALGGHLPADFTHWEWKDKNGLTVAHLVVEYYSESSVTYKRAKAWLKANERP
jgi:hypothetical protein